MRVLISDAISEEGLTALQGAQVDYRPHLPRDTLLAIIGDYDALMVRSQTRVDAAVIEAGKRLKVIGRAGVGVDNIDVDAATQRGIVVVNSPEGNTIAAAELAMAHLLALARRIPQADRSVRAGEWQRNQFVGVELWRKTLGVVGMGKIGREVARRTRAFGMRILAYDPFVPEAHIRQLGAEPADLDTLLRESDFITLHAPLTPETRGLLNRETLARTKPGVRIINCARGDLIDVDALAEFIESGHVAGAALDVFPTEPPPPDLKLLRQSQNVLTPHLGASTVEAQVKVAVDVAEQILVVLQGGAPRSPVNLPPIPPELMTRVEPYLKLAERMGKLHSQLAETPVERLHAVFAGDWGDLPLDLIARASLAGLLQRAVDTPVNLVNAPLIAQQRGVQLEWSARPETELYPDTLTLMAQSARGVQKLTGTVFGRADLRITHLDDLFVDIRPEGILLMTEHHDQPGIIGRVGTVLGQYQVNIAGMHVGREVQGGRAVMILQLDNPVPAEAFEQIRQLAGVANARVVQL
ncbi:MAG: D-3-phosphoglycerate dehydrogenase [Fimbriimonadales bacterium]|nr:MAG: D-3-phosphoglycerate dehydrogenase [Fimbriimonadales bacterium]